MLNDRFVSKDVRESGPTPGFLCRIARDFFINLDYIRYYLLDIQSLQTKYLILAHWKSPTMKHIYVI